MFILIGIMGGIMVNIGCIPQVIKLFRTRRAKDLSLSSHLLYFCGIAFLTVYSIHIEDALFTVLNIVGIIGLLVIISAILLYGKFSTKVRCRKIGE